MFVRLWKVYKQGEYMLCHNILIPLGISAILFYEIDIGEQARASDPFISQMSE